MQKQIPPRAEAFVVMTNRAEAFVVMTNRAEAVVVITNLKGSSEFSEEFRIGRLRQRPPLLGFGVIEQTAVSATTSAAIDRGKHRLEAVQLPADDLPSRL
jgi:hypothetical protein